MRTRIFVVVSLAHVNLIALVLVLWFEAQSSGRSSSDILASLRSSLPPVPQFQNFLSLPSPKPELAVLSSGQAAQATPVTAKENNRQETPNNTDSPFLKVRLWRGDQVSPPSAPLPVRAQASRSEPTKLLEQTMSSTSKPRSAALLKQTDTAQAQNITVARIKEMPAEPEKNIIPPKGEILLPLPLLDNEQQYQAIPLPNSMPAQHENQARMDILAPNFTKPDDSPTSLENTQTIDLAQLGLGPALSPTLVPDTLPDNSPDNSPTSLTSNSSRPQTGGSILDNIAANNRPYSGNTAATNQQNQSNLSELLPPGIQPPSVPLQNGRELNWKFDWLGNSQRKLLYLPKLTFPAGLLRGLEDQQVEIIFQVDASGKVVSASFAGLQLKADNWQINSLLLEKVGQFLFEPQKNLSSTSQWLHKGTLSFRFSQSGPQATTPNLLNPAGPLRKRELQTPESQGLPAGKQEQAPAAISGKATGDDSIKDPAAENAENTKNRQITAQEGQEPATQGDTAALRGPKAE